MEAVEGLGTLDIQHHGKNMSFLFIIADTNFLLIIGLNSGRPLNLIKIKRSFSSSQKHNFLNKCRDCFDEVGTLPKVHYITIDQNITAVVTPA